MSAPRWCAAVIVAALAGITSLAPAQESLQITIRRKAVELAVGDTTTLIAVVSVTSQETPTTVVWSSDDGSIASVDRNGFVRARASGVTRILARVGTAFASTRVTVMQKRPAAQEKSPGDRAHDFAFGDRVTPRNAEAAILFK